MICHIIIILYGHVYLQHARTDTRARAHTHLHTRTHIIACRTIQLADNYRRQHKNRPQNIILKKECILLIILKYGHVINPGRPF